MITMTQERDEAVSMLRIIGEECVLATGLPGGDRVVTLTRVRQIICERDAALREVEELREALTHSVELQSHYAELLNMHDGGERMTFTVETWLARLAALAEKGKP